MRGDRPRGNKIVRAEPVAARAEAGDLHLVAAPWNNAFLDEAEIFPDGPHDDQIDALSGALKAHTRHREIGYLPGCDPQDLRKDSHWTTFEI